MEAQKIKKWDERKTEPFMEQVEREDGTDKIGKKTENEQIIKKIVKTEIYKEKISQSI